MKTLPLIQLIWITLFTKQNVWMPLAVKISLLHLTYCFIFDNVLQNGHSSIVLLDQTQTICFPHPSLALNWRWTGLSWILKRKHHEWSTRIFNDYLIFDGKLLCTSETAEDLFKATSHKGQRAGDSLMGRVWKLSVRLNSPWPFPFTAATCNSYVVLGSRFVSKTIAAGKRQKHRKSENKGWKNTTKRTFKWF